MYGVFQPNQSLENLMNISCVVGLHIYIYNRFPKMEGGLPLNHLFLFGIFHYKPTFWGSTIYGYLYIYVCMYVYAYIYIWIMVYEYL